MIPEPKRLSPLSVPLKPDIRHDQKSPSTSPTITPEVPAFPPLPWQSPFYPSLTSPLHALPYRFPGIQLPPFPDHFTFPSFPDHMRPFTGLGPLFSPFPFPHSPFYFPIRPDKFLGLENKTIDSETSLMKGKVDSINTVPIMNLSRSNSTSPGKESSKSHDGNQKNTTMDNEPPKYQCSGCKKNYSTFSGLSKHRQFHCTQDIKKEFTCKYCDKTYVSLGALKMHIRTHTLPCKCKICGKAFSRPWLLQGHIRTHTGEKPFSCVHCLRAFADRSNLRAHLQTHSDVKKYSCKTCSKTFSRMSLLIKHEETCRTV